MINKLTSQNSFISKFIEYSLPIFIIGIISRTFPLLSFLYYLVPVLLVIYTILGLMSVTRADIGLRILFITFAFPVYCLITSIWSLNTFTTLQRSIYLLLIYTGVLSAAILYIKYSAEKNIEFLIPANILIVIISLVSLIFKIPENGWSGGNGLGFMGFAGHQNTLASAVLFTMPLVLVNRIKDKNPKIKVSYILIFLLLSLNILVLLLTYSRASILSLIVGLIIFLLLIKSKKILVLLISISAVALVLYFTIQPVHNSVNGIINKDGGRILGRRMILWEPSFVSAKLGGVFGLGYGVSAPEIKTPFLTGSHYEDGRYIREKGNSTMAVIEETGLIGLLLFLLPIFISIKKITILHGGQVYNAQFTIKEKLKNNYTFLILISALTAMLVHSQFEAWWVGIGSVQFPIYLIILFMVLYSSHSNNIP